MMPPRRLVAGRLHGAWLALCAMLLLTCAPLLSQALLADAPAWLEALDCADGSGGHSPAAQGQQTPWAKCGYCTLLLSSPALTALAPQLADAYRFSGSQPAIGAACRRAASPVFPGSRSRAPPLH
ncbi:DUF2946 domain-containing protein [Pseudomonas zhanjiangensis]|uniref:DUF2946 domain-containing protein n=1 Tax=Pseudomonas zhanjiangensis TaxID=3239015 RepID=A0ABV3YXN4_9PSED